MLTEVRVVPRSDQGLILHNSDGAQLAGCLTLQLSLSTILDHHVYNNSVTLKPRPRIFIFFSKSLRLYSLGLQTSVLAEGHACPERRGTRFSLQRPQGPKRPPCCPGCQCAWPVGSNGSTEVVTPIGRSAELHTVLR